MATMKAVRFSSSSTSSIFMAQEPIPSPSSKEIIVKVAYTSVNRADLSQRKGTYPPPKGESDIIGLDASGTVYSLGAGVTRWRVGDEVMALLPGGGYAEYTAVHEEHVMRRPENMSLREAAAVPETWLTAYQLMRLVGSVQPGDHVLVHAAASGVGTSALQLLRRWGAVAMATVGSEEKVELCRSLGAQLVVNRKEDPDFHLRVQEATDGRGANVILDCVGASYWEKNAQALAVDGDWVLYGLLGGADVSGPILRHVMAKRARLMGTTLRSRSVEYKAKLVAAFAAEVLPHLSSDGPLRPIIDKEFKLAEAGDAHDYVEASSSAGKVLLAVAAEPQGHQEL